MEDRDHSIWAGCGNGRLWRWREGSWKAFDASDGLPKTNIEGLAQGSDGTLWICARTGGLYRSSGERFVSVANDAELSDGSVHAVTTDSEGSTWVGTASGGLNRLSPRLLQYCGTNAGLPQTAVTSIAEDASGLIWVGTKDKGVHLWNGDDSRSPRARRVSENFPYIYCTAATSDGSIWAAGEQCVFRFQPGQPTQGISRSARARRSDSRVVRRRRYAVAGHL